MQDRLAAELSLHPCAKCGKCLSACPLYLELRDERAVARGKLSLLETLAEKAPELAASPELRKNLFRCLLCGSCAFQCPNGVPAEDLMWLGRTLVTEKQGLPFSKKAAVRLLLKNRNLIPPLLKSGSLLQGLVFRQVPEESGLHLRFPLGALAPERFLPSLPGRTIVAAKDRVIEAPQAKMKVALFTGCVFNYILPQISEAVIKILLQGGATVIIPAEQYCCGMPAYGFGYREGMQALGGKNILAFAGLHADYVLTFCSSCSAMWRHFYPRLAEEGQEEKLSTAWSALNSKVYDFYPFLTEVLDYPRLLAQRGKAQPVLPAEKNKIIYHDPCHLKHLLGVTQEPRRLLAELPGAELIAGGTGGCCGMGGSFNLSYYEDSLKILSRRMTKVRESGATLLATGCSGCLFQYLDAVHHGLGNIRVEHPAILLAGALK